MTAVDRDTFLDAIFPNKANDEHVLLAKQTKLEGGFAHAPHPSGTSRWFRKPGAVYFNVSTVNAPADGERWRRRNHPPCQGKCCNPR